MLYDNRNRKRKHEDKTEKIVSTLVGKILDAQIKTDRNLIELEEKRMKFKQQQRQEEREFQLRLFAHSSLHSVIMCKQGLIWATFQFSPLFASTKA